MSQESIATGYNEAVQILNRTWMGMSLKPVADKLWRVRQYINQQAAAELAESLS